MRSFTNYNPFMSVAKKAQETFGDMERGGFGETTIITLLGNNPSTSFWGTYPGQHLHFLASPD